MCLAVPGRVTSIDFETCSAEIDVMGNRKVISVVLTPKVQVGEWVLVHAGEAISLVSPEDARASLEIWEQLLHE